MSFLKGRVEDDFSGSAKPAPAVSSNPSSLSAFIDQGSEFEGKLTFRDTVRIDGKFRGEISSENTLVIGESGEIDANVRSRSVVVSGVVNGNIFADQKVTLHKSARVDGDVEAPTVVMEEGAVVNGRFSMAPASAGGKAGSSPQKPTKNNTSQNGQNGQSGSSA